MSSTRLPGPSTAQYDRILPMTRLLAMIIVPILVVAFVILYFFPDRSGGLFAWPIRPTMTAMMLGAAYLGGAYFFARVVLGKHWHNVTLGFLPVSAFAGYLGVSTLIHWDKFTPGHISFILWTILYTTLPIVLAFAWFRNRANDPHEPDLHYRTLPKPSRAYFAGVGGLLTGVSLLLFLLPDLMIPTWPWALSPLTARVMAAMFVLPGLVGIGIVLDQRWSAARTILQAQIGAILLILVAMVLARGDFDWSRPVAWTFSVGMGLLCASLFVVYVSMEHHRPGE